MSRPGDLPPPGDPVGATAPRTPEDERGLAFWRPAWGFGLFDGALALAACLWAGLPLPLALLAGLAAFALTSWLMGVVLRIGDRAPTPRKRLPE